MIIKCPKCGALASDRAAGCPSCGEILNAEAYAAEQKAAQEAEAAAAEKPEAEQKAEPEAEPEVQLNTEPKTESAAESEVTAEPETPAVQPAQTPEPAQVPQPTPATQPAPQPEPKKRSWKGFIWAAVAVVALAGALSLYTLAITRMGLDTIKIEVHFYTRPLDTAAADTCAVPSPKPGE